MNKNDFAYIDRFSYLVFVLQTKGQLQSYKKNAIITSLRALYPADVSENEVHPVWRFKKEKKDLVLVNRTGKPLMGICTTLLCCRVFSSYSGRVLYAASDFFEYLDFKDGVLTKSTVCERDTNTKLDLTKADICVGLRKDIPPGAVKVWAFSSFTDIVKRYPCSVLGNKEFDKGRRLRRYCIAFVIMITAFIGVYRLYMTKKEAEKIRHREAAEQREAQAKQKEQEAYLQSLQEKYLVMQRQARISVYKMLMNIYTVTGDTVEISSITVNGNTFQMEARSADAVKTLQAFEKAIFVTQADMRRIAVENTKEYFSMQGDMRYIPPPVSRSDNQAEQIRLYETRLRETEHSGSGYKNSLSDGVLILRKYLHNNNCKETLLQYIKTDSGIETECTLKCRSLDFFTFLQSIDTSDVPFYITLLRIKTTEQGIDVVFRIKEGYVYVPPNAASESVNPEQLSKLFRYPKTNTQYIKPAVRENSVQKDVSLRLKPDRHLIYVGTAQTEHIRYIFVKDAKTAVLYKLPLNAERGNTYRILTDNLFEVHIDGETYEVKK